MRRSRSRPAAALLLFVAAFVVMGAGVSVCFAKWPSKPARTQADEPAQRVCKPRLGQSFTIELGNAGTFEWTCSGGRVEGSGFYIVFVRPSGTYVVLKVPHGRTSFEFTPDTPGSWRWIVINTDPDGTKPDEESEPGHFQVLSPPSPTKKF